MGDPAITRASHVEPDEHGRRPVDLAPLGGSARGPFERRGAALAAERRWLEMRLAKIGRQAT